MWCRRGSYYFYFCDEVVSLAVLIACDVILLIEIIACNVVLLVVLNAGGVELKVILITDDYMINCSKCLSRNNIVVFIPNVCDVAVVVVALIVFDVIVVVAVVINLVCWQQLYNRISDRSFM